MRLRPPGVLGQILGAGHHDEHEPAAANCDGLVCCACLQALNEDQASEAASSVVRFFVRFGSTWTPGPMVVERVIFRM